MTKIPKGPFYIEPNPQKKAVIKLRTISRIPLMFLLVLLLGLLSLSAKSTSIEPVIIIEPVPVLPQPEPEDQLKTLLGAYVKQHAVKRLSTDQSNNIVEAVLEHSDANKLDPLLVLSIIHVESTFDVKAKSSSGAVGLMQVMPQRHKEKLKGRDAKNLDVSVEVGTRILREYVSRSRNTDDALKRYNGSLTSPYGIVYVRKVRKRMNSIKHWISSNNSANNPDLALIKS